MSGDTGDALRGGLSATDERIHVSTGALRFFRDEDEDGGADDISVSDFDDVECESTKSQTERERERENICNVRMSFDHDMRDDIVLRDELDQNEYVEVSCVVFSQSFFLGGGGNYRSA